MKKKQKNGLFTAAVFTNHFILSKEKLFLMCKTGTKNVEPIDSIVFLVIVF